MTYTVILISPQGDITMFWNNDNHNPSGMCCKNELNLCKLCVEKVKAKCIWSDDIKAKEICSSNMKVDHLMVEDVAANNVCVSDTLMANKLKSMSTNTNNLCAQTGVVDKLCVNELTVGSLQHCEKYRASVTLTGDKVYTLGSPINFDFIVNDPNGNVTLSPFSYTIPVSGYYSFSGFILTDQLTAPGVITGVPAGLFTLLANGIELRRVQFSYLSFAQFQDAILSTLLYIPAGTILTMKYDVFIFDQVSGLVPLVGTTVLKSTGTAPFSSGFIIHYLSSIDCNPGQACTPCSPVVIECPIVEVDCNRRPLGQEEPWSACK